MYTSGQLFIASVWVHVYMFGDPDAIRPPSYLLLAVHKQLKYSYCCAVTGGSTVYELDTIIVAKLKH